MINWPDMYFNPINLYSMPRQHRDYMTITRNHAADRRANALKLKPVKPNRNPNSRIVVEPARGVGHSMQTEMIMDCIARRNGARV